jgi:EAL and modified HD-GYP domain-containing signal transduction protein
MNTTSKLDGPAQEQPDDRTAIARQAIVDASRSVIGYELFDRSRQSDNHTAASDAELLFRVLSHIDNEALTDRKTIFVNCTHDSLAGGHLELIQPEKVVLEIPPLEQGEAEDIEARLQTLLEVRKRGFRLAFNQTVLGSAYRSWLTLAAFIKIDLSQLRPEDVAGVIRLAQSSSPAHLIAEKVETAEQFEQVAALGVKLFQGYWFAKPTLVKGQTLRASQATLIQLINLVRQQASTSEIEEVLKHDPTLSFNLLRFINSSGFGLSVEITSFRHAVMILGLKKLFRWAALLMITSRDGGAPPAVASMAVVRGRLMELLAGEVLGPEECDNAFVVGVFSLLDTMLGMPMDKALSAVALPTVVVEALLLRTGPLAPFLDLAEACESANDEAFAKAADTLHLSNRQVNWAHLQALTWAETLLA